MSLFDSVLQLSLGAGVPFKRGESVLICTVDGCMAEKLTVRGQGVIERRISIPCSNGPDLPGVLVRHADGSTSKQLAERLQRLKDGRLVVAS